MTKVYIAPLTLFNSIESLTASYQANSGVTLDSKSPGRFWTSVGFHDTTLRHQQIALLQRVCALENPCQAAKPQLALVKKIQLIIALLYCTKQQIEASCSTPHRHYGVLHQLILQALNLTDTNAMDNTTLNECLATLALVSREQINSQLPAAAAISLTEWENIATAGYALKKSIDNHTDYPVSRATGKVVGAVVAPIGFGIGWVVFDQVGRSMATASLKLGLTSGLVLAFTTLGMPFGVTGGGAALFVARDVAERAVNVGCAISGAHVGMKLLGAIGERTGQLAGFAIDIAYAFSATTCQQLQQLIVTIDESSPVTIGVNVISGELQAYNGAGEAIDLSPQLKKLELLFRRQAGEGEEVNTVFTSNDSQQALTLLTGKPAQVVAKFLTALQTTRSLPNIPEETNDAKEGDVRAEGEVLLSTPL